MTECHHAQITALLATFGFSRVLVSSLLSTSVLVPCTLHILAHPKGAATKPNFDTAPIIILPVSLNVAYCIDTIQVFASQKVKLDFYGRRTRRRSVHESLDLRQTTGTDVTLAEVRTSLQ